MVEKLQGTFEADLTPETNVLLGESVLTVKYKEAVIRGLKVLSEDWLLDSKQQASFLPSSKYHLPILKGVNLALLAFSDCLLQKARTFLLPTQGTFTTSVSQIQNKQVHLVVLSKEDPDKY